MQLNRIGYPLHNGHGDKRLVIFGDSFAQVKWDQNHNILNNVWQKIVADNLGCGEVLNYARGGTSLFFTIQSLHHYIKTEHNDNDIIILFKTSHNRLPVIDNDVDLGWQASLLEHMLTGIKDRGDPRYSYFKANKRIFDWIFRNFTTLENHFALCMLVETQISSMINKSLTLCCFETEAEEFGENFYLERISADEVIDLKKEDMFIKDNRINHLSPDNHEIFAMQICEYFKTNDKSCFDIKKYKKNIL